MVKTDWCEILATPLPTAEAVAFVQDAAAGGVAVFLGTTRAERSASGQTLAALDYEAYGEMAGPQLAELARRAREGTDDAGGEEEVVVVGGHSRLLFVGGRSSFHPELAMDLASNVKATRRCRSMLDPSEYLSSTLAISGRSGGAA